MDGGLDCVEVDLDGVFDAAGVAAGQGCDDRDFSFCGFGEDGSVALLQAFHG